MDVRKRERGKEGRERGATKEKRDKERLSRVVAPLHLALFSSESHNGAFLCSHPRKSKHRKCHGQRKEREEAGGIC